MSSMRKSGSSQAEQDGLKPNKASLKEKDKGHALVNLWGIAGGMRSWRRGGSGS